MIGRLVPRAPRMRWAVYLWVAPTSAVGLLMFILASLSGGSGKVVQGVLEVHGGIVTWLLRHATLLKGGASAMTLGHVVIGRDPIALELTRSHERVHVSQCERWGPFFFPAYLLASLWAWMRGQDAYRDNVFEKEAYGHS